MSKEFSVEDWTDYESEFDGVDYCEVLQGE